MSEAPCRLIDNDGFIHFEPKTENIGQGGRLGFLSADVWLDADGYHVWCAHDCLGERVISMLPWPMWQANKEGRIQPSFSCERCGTHTFLTINRSLIGFTVNVPANIPIEWPDDE
jgi:hypothetical protein